MTKNDLPRLLGKVVKMARNHGTKPKGKKTTAKKRPKKTASLMRPNKGRK